jgi:hypothetical protein
MRLKYFQESDLLFAEFQAIHGLLVLGLQRQDFIPAEPDAQQEYSRNQKYFD